MEVQVKPKASKQIRKFKDKGVIGRIMESLSKLVDFPNTPNVKPLNNHDYQYRMRVGDYRVFFNVDDVIEVVFVEEVKKRDERTY